MYKTFKLQGFLSSYSFGYHEVPRICFVFRFNPLTKVPPKASCSKRNSASDKKAEKSQITLVGTSLIVSKLSTKRQILRFSIPFCLNRNHSSQHNNCSELQFNDKKATYTLFADNDTITFNLFGFPFSLVLKILRSVILRREL